MRGTVRRLTLLPDTTLVNKTSVPLPLSPTLERHQGPRHQAEEVGRLGEGVVPLGEVARAAGGQIAAGHQVSIAQQRGEACLAALHVHAVARQDVGSVQSVSQTERQTVSQRDKYRRVSRDSAPTSLLPPSCPLSFLTCRGGT